MKRSKSIAFVAIFLNGCASQYVGTDAGKVATAIGHINPSRKDTCDTQRQIAEQSSKIETIKQGKEIVYKAPRCEAEKS